MAATDAGATEADGSLGLDAMAKVDSGYFAQRPKKTSATALRQQSRELKETSILLLGRLLHWTQRFRICGHC